ncbi:MAG: M48 family metallopeptidase [Acidobacteriaceae bacterium]
MLLCAGLLLASPEAAFARFQPQPCKNSFSTEQEIALGKKAAAQVYQQMPVLPDSNPVSQYVQQLGAKLVAHAPGEKWPYNFHVADVADINAFALPGGAVFINLGTIQAAETEAQLAGVMAHEISHVVLRHSTCNATKEQKVGLIAGIGQIAAGVLLGGTAGSIAQQGIGLGAGLGFLKMSRGAEQQADLLGTDILYDTGYDPRAMPQFFEVIQGKYGEGGAQFLSDHPNPGNRVGYVNDEIASLPPKTNYIKTSTDFTRIKKLVAGMHAYTAKEVASGVWKQKSPNQTVAGAVQQPSKAVTAADWTPAGAWQTLNGSGFSLGYPGNWKAYGSGASAMIAPQGGVEATASGQAGGLEYGLLTDRFQPSGSNVDIATATTQLVAQIRRDNPQLEPGPATDVIVNNVRGRSLEATNASAGSGGAAEHDWLVAVPQSDGSLRYVVFVAPEGDFNKLRPTFEQILRTLKLQ